MIREKLKERGLLAQVSLTEIPLKGHLRLGPFDIDFVTLTHSIPEPNGLAIRTPLGLVWHTGDWKIDPDPIIGETTDEAKLRSMADEGVLAMVCDSTNVFVEGESGSEADVKEHLTEVIRGCKGKVAVTAFRFERRSRRHRDPRRASVRPHRVSRRPLDAPHRRRREDGRHSN